MSFDHCAFQVSDMTRAIQFYTEKLSFSLNFRATNDAEQEEYAFLSLGNLRLELIQDLVTTYMPPEIKKPYCPHVCIEVPDMKAAIDHLKKQNIRIIKGPLEIANEEAWVYFTDDDNNILEYIQWFKKK